jgi:DNA-directed RNA polymerase subunit beta'
LNLFFPFILKKLIDYEIVLTYQEALELMQENKIKSIIWAILLNLLKDYKVILNRAPTLHKFGVQAFNPILSNEKTISLNPLVCAGFNADFDGDQMAIYIPLSKKAILETKHLLLSSNNLLMSSNGSFLMSPTQDIVLGNYSLVKNKLFIDKLNDNFIFSNISDVVNYYNLGRLNLYSNIWFRFAKSFKILKNRFLKKIKLNKNFYLVIYSNCQILTTLSNKILFQYLFISVGRLFFNNILNYIFKSKRFYKKQYFSKII